MAGGGREPSLAPYGDCWNMAAGNATSHPAAPPAWSRRFVELLSDAMRELWRHSDRLPLDSDDRPRCLAACDHLRALLAILDGGPADGHFLACLPDETRGRLLACCRGDPDAARQYAFEAVLMALKTGFQPDDFGIGLADPADAPER